MMKELDSMDKSMGSVSGQLQQHTARATAAYEQHCGGNTFPLSSQMTLSIKASAADKKCGTKAPACY